MTKSAVRVGDVLHLQRRAVVVDPIQTYGEIGIRSFGRGIFHKEPILGSELGAKRVFEIHPGDLVLNNVFAWEGAVALAGESETGKVGSHRFMTYVPGEGTVDPAWARYFFVSEPGISLLRQASPGSAGRNRTLAIDRFESLVIPLPGLDEQHRTVTRLDSLLVRTALARKAAERRPRELLVGLYPAMVDSIFDRFGAKTKPLSDSADLVSDLVRPGDDPRPAECFVGLQHVESHTGRRLGDLPLGDEKGRKFRFMPGDIVYGYLRPYLNKVWLADRPGLCSVDQYVLRPRDADADLIAHALRARSVLTEAIRLTHNLQLPRLRSGLLLSLQIPAVEERKREDARTALDRALELTLRLVDVRDRQARTLESLDKAILNQAFSGEK